MSEMGRCRDCRWWEDSVQAEDSGKRFCGLATSDDGRALHAGTPFWAVATDGGEAVVFTSADFGCTEFEAKE
jgi:hypothetical protein